MNEAHLKAQQAADVHWRFSSDGSVPAGAMPADGSSDLTILAKRLASIYEQLQSGVGGLHDIADCLYGPRPPQPQAAPSDAPDGPGQLAALNRQAAALSWIADQLGEAIARFSHL